MNIKPNYAQEQALMQLQQTRKDGKNKALIVLPSGTGKTYLSAFDTLKVRGKILYIVHRHEILIQAIKSFKEVHNLRDDEISLFNKYEKDQDGKIVFTTIQTLSKEKNLIKFSPNFFEYIILDEFHHSKAETYEKVLSYFKPKFLLGMTATPYRLDNKDILEAVNKNVPYVMDLKQGIERNLLVPFKYFGLWDNVDYSDIKYKNHRYKENDLDKKLLIDKRDRQIIKEVKKRLKKRKCIGFCNSVNHVLRCVKKFNEAGFMSASITHKNTLEERTKIIEDFRQGKYQILFTRDIFNEGIDFPEVKGLIFLRPTFSKTIFLQQLGRGLRVKEGKKDVVVLDFIGNYVNAYKIKVWLNEINEQGNERETKPIYSYTPRIKIYFQSKVIKIFEIQENKNKPVSKELLIEDYNRIKEMLKRPPYSRDILKYSKYPFYQYNEFFGSWIKFREFMGDSIGITKERFIEIYDTLREELKRPPFAHELEKKISTYKILRKTYFNANRYEDLVKILGGYEEYKSYKSELARKSGKHKKGRTENYIKSALKRNRINGKFAK